MPNNLDILWIAQVSEFSQALTPRSPIGMRRFAANHGELVIPTPERHPFCEFSTCWEGEIVTFVGKEQFACQAGDIFLAGPGLPHWAKGVSYPYVSVAIYFLPSFLIEMGPQADGLRLLRRFLTTRSIRDRVTRPAPEMVDQFRAGFAQVAKEFADHRPGREFRVRASVAMLLTEFDRWEQSQPTAPALTGEGQWDRLQEALLYLQERFAEPVYAADLSDHLNMSESGVKALFRQTLGIPWGRYLQTYRVHRATSLFAAGELNVTEVAAAVGFDTLGHFESTFRNFTGMTPTVFAKSCRGDRRGGG